MGTPRTIEPACYVGTEKTYLNLYSCPY